MLTGEVKKRAIEVITAIIETHQQCRAIITDEVIICLIIFPYEDCLA